MSDAICPTHLIDMCSCQSTKTPPEPRYSLEQVREAMRFVDRHVTSDEIAADGGFIEAVLAKLVEVKPELVEVPKRKCVLCGGTYRVHGEGVCEDCLRAVPG